MVEYANSIKKQNIEKQVHLFIATPDVRKYLHLFDITLLWRIGKYNKHKQWVATNMPSL